MRQLQKIDGKGNFLRFPGVTVVAAVQEKDRDFWKKVHAVLDRDPEIKKYFALLPPESYHATTINLTVEAEYPDSQTFRKFLATYEAYYSQLSQDIQEQSPSLTLHCTGVHLAGNVIQLVVDFTPEQRKQLQAFADEQHLEMRVPPFYHITLAYQYQPFPSPGVGGEIRSRLSEACDELFSTAKELTLSPPTLCSFKDMTQFTPWDGKNLSFLDESKSSNPSLSSNNSAMFPNARQGNATRGQPKLG